MKMKNSMVLIILLMVILCMMLYKNGGMGNKRVVINLASWCGYSKQLMNSGVLEELKNDPEIKVEINVDDKMKDKEYNVEGYPDIFLMTSSGKKKPFSGQRTAENIKTFYKMN